MSRVETLVGKKSTLFSIIVAVIVSILALPIIIPHMLHGYHLAHIFLHIAGIVLSVFISLLAIVAFYKLRTKRLLFSAIAFLNFLAAEIVLLVDSTWPYVYDIGEFTLNEIGHILTFATLGLLALGVFRND